jgi:hypothetical protein
MFNGSPRAVRGKSEVTVDIRLNDNAEILAPFCVHPERFAAAQLKHRDIPNILNLEESGSMRKWANV